MDQKHSMLYPPIEPQMGSIEQDQRSAAIGLPAEAPPSYDMAMNLQQPTSSGVNVIPYEPQPQPNQSIQATTPQVPVTVDLTQTPSALNLGPQPCAITCPACGERKTTRVKHSSNTQTHLAALVLCLVGFCCCACFVPYCMNSCRTGNHYCRKCNTYLGAYKQTIWK